MKRTIPLLFLLAFLPAGSQTVVRLMAYNILNYTSTDQNKTRYLDLRTIVSHFQPDVLMVSELIDGSGAQLLLDSALNASGVATYARAVFVNGPDTDNMLFYNTSKVSLKSQQQISTNLRDISHYRIYRVLGAGDTAFINLFSVHLKASNSVADANDRYNEALAFCNYISTIPQTENLIIGGDFNFYSNQEPAWTLLTGSNCSHTFIDPINTAGAWNNNVTFASVHTQSTRNVSSGCCGGSTGGLDDRFDFLLANAPVINGTAKVKYLTGTYKACGNDANHFNKAINETPANTAVPANVATALYNMADHLPVAMDLDIGNAVGINEYAKDKNLSIRMCVDGGVTNICVYSQHTGAATVNVYDMTGRMAKKLNLELNKGFAFLPDAALPLERGTYLVTLETTEGLVSSCLYTK